MRFPFTGQWPLTQDWGNKLIINGVDIYGQFGLKGHNGTDWGLPTGTAVIAPHEGRIIEVASDPNGYGNYVKIETVKFGSILAHFKNSIVTVGQYVTEGQIVGYSNNTGNSTGPHLHWGLYPIPRNKSDGYSGTVDPFQYIGGNMDNPDWLIKNSDSWIGTLAYLEITKSSPTLDDVKDVVGGIKARASDMEKQKGQVEANLITAEKTISNQADLLLKAENERKDLNSKLIDTQRINAEQQGQIKGMIAEHGEVLKELAECKSKREYNVKLRVKDWFIGKYK